MAVGLQCSGAFWEENATVEYTTALREGLWVEDTTVGFRWFNSRRIVIPLWPK